MDRAKHSRSALAGLALLHVFCFIRIIPTRQPCLEEAAHITDQARRVIAITTNLVIEMSESYCILPAFQKLISLVTAKDRCGDDTSGPSQTDI